ncbi:hypothetical protein R0K17_17740, partial [Planococcus sp. SIMBA_143]
SVKSKEITVDEVKKELKEKVRPVKKEAVIYVGSTLTGLGLQQYSIFKNGIPKNVQLHIDKCNAIGALTVPVSQLSQARKNIHTPGTAEYVLNQQVLSYARGDQ